MTADVIAARAGGATQDVMKVGKRPPRVADNVVSAASDRRADAPPLTVDGQPAARSHHVHSDNTVGKENAGHPHVGVAAYYIATIDPNKTIVDPARSSWFQPPN